MSPQSPDLYQHLTSLLIGAIGSLPLEIRRLMAKIVGRLVALVPSREQRVCTLHLKHFLPEGGAKTVQVYQHLVTVLFESFDLTPILDDEHQLDQAQLVDYWNNRDASRGIIALSAHLGNWELLAASAIRHQIPLQVVGREARRGAWQIALERIRHAYGAEILWRSDSAAVKKMIGLLKSGAVIAALIDQDTEVRSEFIPFFGRMAKTPSALVELGLRTNAQFVSAFTVRDVDNTYRLVVQPISTAAGTSVSAVLSQYHRQLELLIRDYPTQWAWVHKRWRSLEGGKRLSSREYISMLEGL